MLPLLLLFVGSGAALHGTQVVSWMQVHIPMGSISDTKRRLPSLSPQKITDIVALAKFRQAQAQKEAPTSQVLSPESIADLVALAKYRQAQALKGAPTGQVVTPADKLPLVNNSVCGKGFMCVGKVTDGSVNFSAECNNKAGICEMATDGKCVGPCQSPWEISFVAKSPTRSRSSDGITPVAAAIVSCCFVGFAVWVSMRQKRRRNADTDTIAIGYQDVAYRAI
jgi:hypothetical protein